MRLGDILAGILTHLGFGPKVPTIAVCNTSKSGLSDAEVQSKLGSLQLALSRDFKPVWGKDALYVFVPAGKSAPIGSWQMTLLDYTDHSEAMAYHSMTWGLPWGRIFVQTVKSYAANWTVSLTHEVYEALCDPELGGIEVCDPCETEEYSYMVNGVWVSDCTTPAYWGKAPGTRYDIAGKLTKPHA